MCVFCKIINNEFNSYKVYEDEDVLAILDISQATKGHTLVIPKKHYKNIFEVDSETLSKMIKVVKLICDKYKEKLGVENLNLVNNNGAVAGQTVDHYHIHIVPRYEDDNFVDAVYTNNSKNINFEELLKQING